MILSSPDGWIIFVRFFLTNWFAWKDDASRCITAHPKDYRLTQGTTIRGRGKQNSLCRQGADLHPKAKTHGHQQAQGTPIRGRGVWNSLYRKIAIQPHPRLQSMHEVVEWDPEFAIQVSAQQTTVADCVDMRAVSGGPGPRIPCTGRTDLPRTIVA